MIQYPALIVSFRDRNWITGIYSYNFQKSKQNNQIDRNIISFGTMNSDLRFQGVIGIPIPREDDGWSLWLVYNNTYCLMGNGSSFAISLERTAWEGFDFD